MEKLKKKELSEQKEQIRKPIRKKELEHQKDEKNVKQTDCLNKKTIAKSKISIYQIVVYFIIYSIIGYIIETIFGLITKGVIESRQNFLYGPFCSIYGVGGLIAVVGLQKFKKNNFTLFLGGVIIGSFVEYFISLFGELIFHIKWWDYSNLPFNINGRICIAFSILWGFLGIFFMRSLHPHVEKIVDRFSKKAIKIIAIVGIIFFTLNMIITSLALEVFFKRLVNDYNLELINMDNYIVRIDEIYNNQTIKKISDKFFTNEKMLKTFPNIKVTNKDGEIIYVREILKDIQPYYFKIFTPRFKVDENGNLVNSKKLK